MNGTRHRSAVPAAWLVLGALALVSVRVVLHAQSGTPYRVLLTDDFARFIEAEQKLWWPVVKGAGAY